LVEQLIRNQQVVSSSLTVGSSIPIPRLRSGFRLRARAALTPAQRLKFKSDRRLQHPDPSTALGISPAGYPFRFAQPHARMTAQF
jgi:hypothetical protein